MRYRHLLILIFFTFLFQGCGSQKRVLDRYYLIEEPKDNAYGPDIPGTPVDAYCEIVPVEIHPAYATNRIANRGRSREITYYSYHQWVVRPGESFTLMLERYLDQHQIFTGLTDRYRDEDPAFSILTRIDHLEVYQADGEFSAHIDLEFRMVHQQQGVVLTHKADRFEPLSQKDLNVFAETIGAIYMEELRRFITSGVNELRKVPDPQGAR